MSSWFVRLLELIGFCQHRWEFERRIREQNLRYGYRHQSDIYHCSKCNRYKTEEVPGSQTRM